MCGPTNTPFTSTPRVLSVKKWISNQLSNNYCLRQIPSNCEWRDHCNWWPFLVNKEHRDTSNRMVLRRRWWISSNKTQSIGVCNWCLNIPCIFMECPRLHTAALEGFYIKLTEEEIGNPIQHVGYEFFFSSIINWSRSISIHPRQEDMVLVVRKKSTYRNDRIGVVGCRY